MFTQYQLLYFTFINLIMTRYLYIIHVLLTNYLNANDNKPPKYEKGYDRIFKFEYMISRRRKKQFVYAVPATYVDLHMAWEHSRRRLPNVPNPPNVILWNGHEIPDECAEDFRFESLHNFRFKDNIIAPLEDLARSGFYCLEDGLEIRCACCFSLYPFNSRFANAHSAHTRINPNCPMLIDETVRNQYAATRQLLLPAPALPDIDECRSTTAIPDLTRAPEQVNPSNELRISEVSGNEHTEWDQPSVKINNSHDENNPV